VVILASSILSTDKVLRSLPLQRLKRSTLFVDVLSVKVFPKMLLLRELPTDFDILCTHPMFGPDSGRGSWAGLNFQYEKVRVAEDPRRQARVDALLNVSDFPRAAVCAGLRLLLRHGLVPAPPSPLPGPSMRNITFVAVRVVCLP